MGGNRSLSLGRPLTVRGLSIKKLLSTERGDHHGFWGFSARGRAELFPPEACYALDSAVYIQATADAPAYAVNPEDAPEYGL